MNLKQLFILAAAIVLPVIELPAIANPKPSVFCSGDAAALLGDVCVDGQGRIPDNADIRSVFLYRCTPNKAL